MATAYVRLEQMPLTANGKVDRKGLPEPEQQQGVESEREKTAVEEIVAGIWAEVLGLQRVEVNDNFFEIGGHSLLATQLLSRLRQTFSVEMSLRALFESPTIEALAMRIQLARGVSPGLAAPELRRLNREGGMPLSFAQQRLWFIDQFDPATSAYIIAVAVKLEGSFNIVALEQALSQIIRRHEALRTRFVSTAGEPMQVIEPWEGKNLAVLDLSGLGEQQREKTIRGIIEEESSRGFDLTRGPVIRQSVLRINQQEHVLLVSVHHIVSDGWSGRIMMREIASLYEAFITGENSPLEELQIQYGDYAVWQREWLTQSVLEAELEYWSERLRALPAVLELATDRPRPAVQTFRGASYQIVMPVGLSEGLKQMSRREGLTLYMMLLAGLQVTLWRYSGQKDIAVGTPIAGRKRVEIESLIGFFVNTLVMRTRLDADASTRTC